MSLVTLPESLLPGTLLEHMIQRWQGASPLRTVDTRSVDRSAWSRLNNSSSLMPYAPLAFTSLLLEIPGAPVESAAGVGR